MTPLRCAVMVLTFLLFGIAPGAFAASAPASQPVTCAAHAQAQPCCAAHAQPPPCCAAHAPAQAGCAAHAQAQPCCAAHAQAHAAPASAPTSQPACAHTAPSPACCAQHTACATPAKRARKACAASASACAPGRRIPWAVTRHPVTDTVSQGVDLALRPAHWVMATPLWWLEDQVYRDEGLGTRVRLHMASPAEQ